MYSIDDISPMPSCPVLEGPLPEKAIKALEIAEIFAMISLQTDPSTSLSLSCVNRQIHENRKNDIGYINDLFNHYLGTDVPTEERSSICLMKHHSVFSCLFFKVQQCIEFKKMGQEEDLNRVCWSDLRLLKKWVDATEKLVVWKELTQAIYREGPSAKNLSNIDSCLEEADKFPHWFSANIEQLLKVQKLDLAGKLIAQLPSEIGQLVQFRGLNLSCNLIEKLPAEIFQLTNLQFLKLDSNRLSDLPIEIGQLTRLQQLHLNSNYLTQLPPTIGKLSHLKLLNIEFNQLNLLPSELCQLIQLRSLNLKYNQLQQLPSDIGQLKRLEELNLAHNRLVKLPDSVGKLHQLKTLRLEHNRKLHTLPAQIFKNIWLQELSLTCKGELSTEFNQLRRHGCVIRKC